PEDLEAAKIAGTAIYKPVLVGVRGNYDRVNRLCAQIADQHGWGFVNVNLRTYYGEGSKTVGYELAEQLGWKLPGHVVSPMAGGSLIGKVEKAFGELATLGLVEAAPFRVHGAQPLGCNPIVGAFKQGLPAVKPVKPDTIVRSLAIGDPADGPAALATIRRTGGRGEDPTHAGPPDGRGWARARARRLRHRLPGLAQGGGGAPAGRHRPRALPAVRPPRRAGPRGGDPPRHPLGAPPRPLPGARPRHREPRRRPRRVLPPLRRGPAGPLRGDGRGAGLPGGGRRPGLVRRAPQP